MGVHMASTGSEIANAYVALTVRAPGVKKDVEELFGQSSGKAAGTKFSAGFAGAVGGVVATVATKAMSSISSAIDGAISRVDTLNNFPKIMENLGYEGGEAASAIETMSDKLTGLPTSLDAMAGMVQQIAPLTDGLGEATDLSLALNNALLAGGKSTDLQNNAMEQYSQMLATGTVDLEAWRSIVTAMPGQMSQLAQSMLGAGSTAFDLYDSMKAGETSFDDFNNAVLKLNSEGVNGFTSFEEQARASTDGIATSQANLNTAITRNLASIIQKLKPVIDAMTSGATQIVNALGPVVTSVIDIAFAIVEWGQANKTWLAPVGVAIGTIVAAFVAWNVITRAWLALQAIVKGVQIAWIAATYGMTAASYGYQGASKIAAAAQWAFNAALNANPIMLIVTAIAALVAGLVYFFTQTELGQEIWANFTQFLTEAWTNIATFFSDTWTNISNFFVDTWTNISTFFTDTVNNIVSFFEGAIEGFSTAWEAIWTGIGDFLKDIWNNIIGWIEGGVNGAIDLINGLMGGIRDVAGFIGIEVGEIPHVSIPRLAKGGVVQRSRGGTLATIGEGRYDEAVIPLSPQVLAQIGGGGSGGRPVEMTVQASPGMDEAVIGQVAAEKLNWKLRGA